jgi:GGDEF domain-containing protein
MGVGGSFERALEGGVAGAGWWRNLFGAFAKGAGQEGGQEFIQTGLENVVHQGAGDRNRPWSQGAFQAAVIGAITGTGIEGATHAAVGTNDNVNVAGEPLTGLNVEGRTPFQQFEQPDAASPLQQATARATESALNRATGGQRGQRSDDLRVDTAAVPAEASVPPPESVAETAVAPESQQGDIADEQGAGMGGDESGLPEPVAAQAIPTPTQAQQEEVAAPEPEPVAKTAVMTVPEATESVGWGKARSVDGEALTILEPLGDKRYVKVIRENGDENYFPVSVINKKTIQANLKPKQITVVEERGAEIVEESPQTGAKEILKEATVESEPAYAVTSGRVNLLNAPQGRPSPAGVRRLISEREQAQAERRQVEAEAAVDKKTGLQSQNQWVKAQPRIDADPSREVVVMDVNDLKRFNDDHGHEVGDAYLGHVGRVAIEEGAKLGISPRQIYRFGGDEIHVDAPTGKGKALLAAIKTRVAEFKRGEVTGSVAGGVGQTTAIADKLMYGDKRVMKAGKTESVITSVTAPESAPAPLTPKAAKKAEVVAKAQARVEAAKAKKATPTAKPETEIVKAETETPARSRPVSRVTKSPAKAARYSSAMDDVRKQIQAGRQLKAISRSALPRPSARNVIAS